MGDDIVTRLRRVTAKPLGMVIDPPPDPLCAEAADEIERLRAEVTRLEELGDALAVVAFHDTQGWSRGHKAWKPLKAWQEARRG